MDALALKKHEWEIGNPLGYPLAGGGSYWVCDVFRGDEVLAEVRGASPELARMSARHYLRNAEVAHRFSIAKGQVRLALKWLRELSECPEQTLTEQKQAAKERVAFLERNLAELDKEGR